MTDSLLITATVVFTLFAFAFGACFGSFLNVVVWRLPRRMPIVVARSHCPKCKQNILGRDNIPIWGWLSLRGRCRFCQQPISFKYPLIEFLVGLLFALLFVVIVVLQGATLPAGWGLHSRAVWLADFPDSPLLGVFFHQIILGYFLLGLALIDEEGQTTPWHWILIAAMLHLGLIFWNPALNQLDLLSIQGAGEKLNRPPSASWQQSLTYSGFGLFLATIIGACGMAARVPHQRIHILQALLLIGLFMGPVVVLGTSLIAFTSWGVQWLSGSFSARKPPKTSGLALQLFCAWLLMLLSWRWWPAIAWPGLS